MIEIIDYTETTRSFIRDLNYEWLQKYFAVEPSDERQLTNPQKEIIEKGGHIYYATYNAQIVGTATLIPSAPGVVELGKMAVTEAMQGRGIAQRLLLHCMNKAKEFGATKVILYSSTKLQRAISLYRKFGFVEVPLIHSQYVRSDLKMEKDI